MKKNLLFALMLFASTTFATVRTVNNYGGAQYYDIESAINAASPGDTIYIHGTLSYYCRPNVKKNNLTFIGPGFNPQKQSSNIAYIQCGGWMFGNDNVVIGLDIQSITPNGNDINGVPGFVNTTFKRCRIYGADPICPGYGWYSSSYNMRFEDCIFSGSFSVFSFNYNCYTNNNLSSVSFSNCLFYNSAVANGMNNGTSSIIVDHCIFYYDGSPTGVIINCNGNAQMTFTNNIFVNKTISNSSTNGYYYNNYSTTENLNTLGGGGSGNLQGANPMFVNAPGGTFAYTHDYHLAGGSPCIGTGTNGIDMGIYSGTVPMIWEGYAPIPQMDSFNIIGTQVPQNGSLNINFQSTIKN